MTPLVLVVEDREDLRELLTINLELKGYRVTQAGTGATALSAIAEERPDLVLLDIRMPDGDGWSVLERLREGRTALPAAVIVLSAHADEEAVARALELGCRAFLTKPFTQAELLAAVGDAVGSAGSP